MQLLVEIGTTVFDDDKAVIGICGFPNCRKNDTAGGDAKEDQGVDVVSAEDHFEIGTGEGADPVLGDDNVVRLWPERGMNGGCGTLEEALMLRGRFDGGKQAIVGADLRKIRTKADRHMDDAHSSGSGMLQHVCRAGEQLLVFEVDRDDADLEIHAENSCPCGMQG